MQNRRLTPSDATVATLFREHHGELVRLAVLMVGDLPTAEDVVQDVYASLHSRWSQIAAGDTVLPYVRAAVLDGCRSVLRRRNLARRAGAAHREEPADGAESELIPSEDRRAVLAVLAALARLPRRRREVLVLRTTSACPRPRSRAGAVRPVSSATAQTRRLVVERISAASGSVLATEYRTAYQSPVGTGFVNGRAAMVSVSPDPTGRYLLLSSREQPRVVHRVARPGEVPSAAGQGAVLRRTRLVTRVPGHRPVRHGKSHVVWPCGHDDGGELRTLRSAVLPGPRGLRAAHRRQGTGAHRFRA